MFRDKELLLMLLPTSGYLDTPFDMYKSSGSRKVPKQAKIKNQFRNIISVNQGGSICLDLFVSEVKKNIEFYPMY